MGSDHSFQRAEVLRNIHRIGPEDGQVDHLQRSRIGGGQHDRRSYTSFVRLSPAFSNHTPPISGLQTGKAVLRHGRDQVISDAALMIKKCRRHHRAHQMACLRGP